MAAPIRLGWQTLGVVEVLNPQHGHFDEGDKRLLMNVAVLAAGALQNARLFTRARDAEQRYTLLFEDSADPIVITDAAGLITDVNRRFCEMLGYEKEALFGRQAVGLYQDPQGMEERLTRALAGENIFCSVSIAAQNGSFIPFEVRATRVFHRARLYVQWVCHSLAERLQLEQVRKDLTHMIIHDLRNPLTSMMNSVELIEAALKDKRTTIPMDELFAIAQRSGQRLYLLIDSILDLARLEEGRADLARKQLDIEDLVRDAVEQLGPTAAARGIHMTSQVAAGLPLLQGDRDLLQRVLLNLLSNAVKFTSHDGTIHVQVTRLDEDKGVLFAVSDTGMGIPPDQHQRIFDRFARVPDNQVRGTGLGLALCKLAVEAHGGRIWVESEPGHGATFKFTLPVDDGGLA
jgi:PAS domain S-box-containing protein